MIYSYSYSYTLAIAIAIAIAVAIAIAIAIAVAKAIARSSDHQITSSDQHIIIFSQPQADIGRHVRK